jgi:adenylate kinase
MQLSNVVVTGKSGAGKQPRIDVLVEAFGLTQLSTGNIFREYLGAWKKLTYAGTPDDFWCDGAFLPPEDILKVVAPLAEAAGVAPATAVLGMKAARFVDQGLFVPDNITNELFASTFEAAGGKGLVLDGYPRTTDQSAFLLELTERLGTKLDVVLLVDNENEAIVARTTGRRICPNKACGKVFHVEYKPPTPDGRCRTCGTDVILRSDDSEEKIRSRLREFESKAQPAIDALVAAGEIPMATVPGNLPVFTDEAVRQSVMTALARVGIA